MAFITEESGICLSKSGETVFPVCGKIVEEGAVKYTLTESNKVLKADGDCSDLAIPTFACDTDRVSVDSGQSVVIVNTCTLPITITGFRNTDAERFTIFKYPEYLGISIYESGAVSELPFTIDPSSTAKIPTFFHPLESELINGKAGTFDDRDGDSFHAEIDIYPGFNIKNCSSSDLECDADFILSGEFICVPPPALEFLGNNKNFVAPDLTTINKIETAYCLQKVPPRDGIISFGGTDGVTVPDVYKNLSGISEAFFRVIGGGWYDQYGDMGLTGAIGAFHYIVTGIMDAGQDNDINNLISSSVSNHQVSYEKNGTIMVAESSYRPNNITTLSTGGYEYTGMFFESTPVSNVSDISNQVIFFNGDVVQGKDPDARMFLVESGNFSTDKICG